MTKNKKINPFAGGIEDQAESDLLWVRDLFLTQPTSLDKIVVFGHTPTINLQNDPGIWVQQDKIGVDGGCVFGYRLNALEITEEEYREHSVKMRKKNDSK